MAAATLAAAIACNPARAAPAANASSWVSEYPRVAAQAEKDCAGDDLHACQARSQRLYQLLDGRPDVVYRLAKVAARLGNDAAGLKWLEIYSASALDFGDPAAQPEFARLRTDRRFQGIEQAYRDNLRPQGTHAVLATFPGTDLVAEDIGIDPRDGNRYASSVREGRVLRLDASGRWSDFAGRAALDAWGLYALVVDTAQGKLWLGSVAGAVSPPFRNEEHGRSAVLRVDLDTRSVERRYELQDGREHAFGDMALATDGSLLVSDGLGGGVYRITRGAAALEPIVPPGELRSPQTPVPLPGGERVLVADYSRGIAIVALSGHAPPTWLAHPPELALYGIDGLYLRGHTLVAIQNGTTPERLLRLELDAGFTRVVKWDVLLARAPGLGDPTHGFIAGKRFQFIANSGWDRVDDDGHMRTAGAAGAPAIWSVDLPD